MPIERSWRSPGSGISTMPDQTFSLARASAMFFSGRGESILTPENGGHKPPHGSIDGKMPAADR